MWMKLRAAFCQGAFPGAALLLLVACAGGTSESNQQPGNAPTSVVAASANLGGKISDSSMRELVPQSSEFQRKLFADQILTLAEYEAAKLAEIQCLKEAGLGIEGDTRLNGLYFIRFLIVSTGPTDPSRSAIAECRTAFADIVDMIWAEVSIPLVQDVIQESRRLMAECYKRNQLRVDEKPHDSLDPEIEARYASCLAQVNTSLNLGGVSYGVEGDGRPR